MMRQALYRGKRVDNGEWVYGVPIEKYGKTYIISGTHSFAHTTYNQESVVDFLVTAYEVVPESVGEDTNQTDKNGVEIFEGDLLKGFQYPFFNSKYNAHNYFAEVVWVDDCSAFGLYTHKYPSSVVSGMCEAECELMQDFDNSQWEVIGNKYDNPELLKED